MLPTARTCSAFTVQHEQGYLRWAIETQPALKRLSSNRSAYGGAVAGSSLPELDVRQADSGSPDAPSPAPEGSPFPDGQPMPEVWPPSSMAGHALSCSLRRVHMSAHLHMTVSGRQTAAARLF